MAFATAAAALVGLAFSLALLVAGARETVIDRLQASAPRLKRWTGALLLVVGVWTLLLGLLPRFFAGIFLV